MDSGVKTVSPNKPTPRSPWGSPLQQVPPTCSFLSVMDEELAKSFQAEEEEHLRNELGKVDNEISSTKVATDPTDSDFVLAQMLQLEFDREHDRQLVIEEKHYNKQSKVKISFENYRSLPPSYLEDQSDSDIENEDKSEDEYQEVSVPRSGRRKGVAPGQATKHDPKLCGQKNVRNMEKFPPDFPVGDIHKTNPGLHLQNSVYNVLREHSVKEERLSHRFHEKKEHSTQELVLDPKTRLMLFKLVDNGLLTEINGCLSTGKEAAVFHAAGGQLDDDRSIPAECAIKIFKTTLNEFFRRDKYIKDDYRFKNRFGKQNPRKIVRLWAEKEMHNLKRLHSHGIPCPEVVLLKKHVLIMSFIGKDQCPAPKLKEADLSPDQVKSAYHQCVQIMGRMYSECHLVHADLNEYNMLWFDGGVYIIDVSQSVEPSHPHGLEFLLRDCVNVSSFFRKKDVPETLSPYELFNKITGLKIESVTEQEFLADIRVHTQRQLLMDVIHDKKEPYPFDYFFKQTIVSGETQNTVDQSSSDSNEENCDDGSDED